MSKFAMLPVEGLSSSEDEAGGQKRSAAAVAGKKKQQQHKAAAAAAAGSASAARKKQTPELHQLQQSQQLQPKPRQQRHQQAAAAAQEEEWSRKDTALTEAIYQRELAEAMMASKLDSSRASGAVGGAAAASLASIEAASKRAASDSLKREKQTERDRLRREVELSLQASFQAVVAEKDSEIAVIQEERDSLAQRAATSEKEVERLTSLLSLVEGKKAKGLAEQIYQLTCVIQELTDHSKMLDSELAKERTRAHQLQEQLDRLKPAR